jgi:hypothetical protein
LRFIKNDKCLSLHRNADENAQGFSMSHSPNDKVIVASWSNGDVRILAY